MENFMDENLGEDLRDSLDSSNNSSVAVSGDDAARGSRKLRVAVLFGGCSSEYAVSLQSAASVLRVIDRSRYEVLPIGITREGEWFRYVVEDDTDDWISRVENDTWHLDAAQLTPVILSQSREVRGFYELPADSGFRVLRVDLAFPVLHGKNGEDGTVQGLFELAGISLVGCGTLSSALCMDKGRAHELAEHVGIYVPRAITLWRSATGATGTTHIEDKRSANVTEPAGADATSETTTALPTNVKSAAVAVDEGRSTDDIVARVKNEFPQTAAVFVKPVRAGSSFGISKVLLDGMNMADTDAALLSAIETAFQHDDEVIIEEAIDGFEVGCAVVGEDDLTVGRVDEIELKIAGSFFDFDEKYSLVQSEIHTPARIDAETEQRIQNTAKKIYRTLGCSGFARVDMFLTPRGKIVFNEVNTIPGFTSHSRFPRMMDAAGVPFAELVARLLADASAKCLPTLPRQETENSGFGTTAAQGGESV